MKPDSGDKVEADKADKKEKAGKPKKRRIVLAVIAAVITVGLMVVLAMGAAQNFIGNKYDSNGNAAEAKVVPEGCRQWTRRRAEQAGMAEKQRSNINGRTRRGYPGGFAYYILLT